MSSSSSSSSTSTATRDGRVAGDNGAIGVSSEGDVLVNIVPDEAFELGQLSVQAAREIAEASGDGALEAIYEMRRLAESSNKQVGDTARDSISEFRDFGEFAVDQAGDLANDAIDKFADLAESSAAGARDTLQSVTGEFAGALARTQQHARSESTQLAEQMIKIGLPAVAVMFAVSQVWGK